MRTSRFLLIVCAFALCATAYSQPAAKLSVQLGPTNEIIIAVDHKVHGDYGLSYPMTYQLLIPSGSANLVAHRKFTAAQEWTLVAEKTAADFFNGIEAVRFDYERNLAYFSVAFGSMSDSIFLKISNHAGESVLLAYTGITRHYDNRQAAVTLTADDWHPSFDAYFLKTLGIFRKYRLYVSTAVVTEWCDAITWQHIQAELDSGYVEVMAHGRNHLHAPYPDAAYEVTGAKQDLTANLDLPVSSRNGEREYVYVWVAPYGEYDDRIDDLVSQNQYLVSRLVNFLYGDFSRWNDQRKMYDPIGVVHEMGPLWGGVTDTTILNGDFDNVVAAGGVYHVMCHPHVIESEWDKPYLWSHLNHISNRKNLWYVNLGHLYLYHLLQDPNSTPVTTTVASRNDSPVEFIFSQNYPNPFNPTTTIAYQLAKTARVRLSIFNAMGHLISTLVDEPQSPGRYSVQWRGEGCASGTYFYQIQADRFTVSRKMTLLR